MGSKPIPASKSINKTYGKATVISVELRPVGRKGRKATWANCVCTCGRAFDCRLDSLRTGDTTSCGCIQARQAAEMGRASTTHGYCRDYPKEYKAWNHMNDRGGNPTIRGDYYWVRFIRVVPRWRRSNPNGFKNFLADMGPRPGPGYEVSRIPHDDLPYGPLGYWGPGTGCLWATRSENMAEVIRGNEVWYKLPDGGEVSERAAARHFGVTQSTLQSHRRRYGKTLEQIVEHFVNKQKAAAEKAQAA